MGAAGTPITFEDYLRQQSRAQRQAGRLPRSGSAVLGTVDPFWTAGLPTVTVDGLPDPTGGYRWDPGVTNWKPSPGQRVYLIPAAPGGYIIGGPIAEVGPPLMLTVPITSWFGNATVYDTAGTYHIPAVTLSSDGFVELLGLWKFTVTPGAVATKIAQLPDPRFYPDRAVIATTSGNQTIAQIEVRTDGSVWYLPSASGSAISSYFSLSGTRYPAAGKASWTKVREFGDNLGPAFSVSTITGTPAIPAEGVLEGLWWWIDEYGLLWLSGGYVTSAAIATDNTLVVSPNGAWTVTYQQHAVAAKTGGNPVGFGILEVGNAVLPNALVYKGPTSALAAGDTVRLDGVILRTADADANLNWIAPTFTNSWANYGNVFSPAGWARIGDRFITRGLVRNGTVNASMFATPAGTRPLLRTIDAAWSNNAVGRLDQAPDGSIIPLVGSNIWFSLDNHTKVPEA